VFEVRHEKKNTGDRRQKTRRKEAGGKEGWNEGRLEYWSGRALEKRQKKKTGGGLSA